MGRGGKLDRAGRAAACVPLYWLVPACKLAEGTFDICAVQKTLPTSITEAKCYSVRRKFVHNYLPEALLDRRHCLYCPQ